VEKREKSRNTGRRDEKHRDRRRRKADAKS